MSAKLEKVALIKGQIAKACNELEHGDTPAAIMALAEGLSALLSYVLEQEEAAFGFQAPKSRMLKK